MAQIQVSNLTFAYEGSYDDIFENVSFSIDSRWKLGFIGRNGKGKTTFLQLLRGEYRYQGSILPSIKTDYFPYTVGHLDACAADQLDDWKPGVEFWRVLMEMEGLHCDPELLYRPMESLSFGECTKIMLAVLFAGENEFLLIDEPTNHLDMEARQVVKEYLQSKQGFILVSHDRDLLDACIDHVLVLNRKTIEVQAGNFSSWWANKEKKDAFAKAENEKHLKEIQKLKTAADRSSRWADKNENTKIGYDPIKEHDRSLDTRAQIGAKTKKMESRVKSYQKRISREIEEKEGLLQDIEYEWNLKVTPLVHPKKRLISASDLTIDYGDGPIFHPVTFDISQGEKVFLQGANGSGKSSIIKAILGDLPETAKLSGRLLVASNLTISYISQDTSHLHGTPQEYAAREGLDRTQFLTMLRQLDMDRVQFDKDIADFSEGQKKKVLIASSLMTPAHLYIWDEPLNYIDVFSRMQIEKVLESFNPTMLVVEHDQWFMDRFATKIVQILSHESTPPILQRSIKSVTIYTKQSKTIGGPV